MLSKPARVAVKGPPGGREGGRGVGETDAMVPARHDVTHPHRVSGHYSGNSKIIPSTQKITKTSTVRIKKKDGGGGDPKAL